MSIKSEYKEQLKGKTLGRIPSLACCRAKPGQFDLTPIETMQNMAIVIYRPPPNADGISHTETVTLLQQMETCHSESENLSV